MHGQSSGGHCLTTPSKRGDLGLPRGSVFRLATRLGGGAAAVARRPAVAHSVALPPGNQRQMGNKRPRGRARRSLPQAQTATSDSRKCVQRRTFNPAAQMRNSLGAPFVLQALSQKPMNRARPLPALSPHPSNKRKAVNNRRICRPLRPLAQLRTALSDGSHEAQLSLCTAGVRGSISLWPATTGSKSARQGVGLPLGSSRAV